MGEIIFKKKATIITLNVTARNLNVQGILMSYYGKDNMEYIHLTG
jgi:hypothetical protein